MRAFFRRVRGVVRAEAIHREIDEEAEFHIEMRTAENIRRGMPPLEARRDAERRFGNLMRVKEQGYEVRGGGWLEIVWQDLRQGARTLLKRPLFTLAVVLTLALGLGANTAIFSVFNGTILRPLPYRDPDRLVYLWKSEGRGVRYQPESHSDFGSLSPGSFHEWRERNRSFESMTAYRANSTILSDGDQAIYVHALRVAGGFFETLGAGVQIGRAFTDQDYSPGAPGVVILPNDMWHNRYGADPQIIGRTLSIDGLPYTVIGVMPPGFWPTDSSVHQIWIPYSLSAEEKANHRSGSWSVVARLRSGISFDHAQAEMDFIAAQLEAAYPEHYRNKGITLVSASRELLGTFGNLERIFLLLLCVAGLVLLIACVNVANLLLVRGAEREREFAVRAALGASRGRLLRQLLTESLLLAAAGGAFGILLGMAGMRSLTALLAGFSTIPRSDDLHFDWQAFAFTACMALATGLFFGLVPAARASRPDLQDALREGGHGKASSRRLRRAGSLLVIGEVALSMLLLVGAGLIVQSLIRLQQVDPGFAASRLLTVKVNVPDYKYGRMNGDSRSGSKEMNSRIELYRQVEQRLNALSGVESAAAAGRLPVVHGPDPTNIGIEWRASAAERLEGCEEFQRKTGLSCQGTVGTNRVTPAYFRTLGMRLIRGRFFGEHDTADASRVAVINETAARRYWPNEDPVGKRFTLDFSSWFPQSEVVGVVADIKTDGLERPPYPEIYWTMAQMPSDDCLLIVRTRAEPEAMANVVREEMAQIDRQMPLRGVRTMEDLIANTMGSTRLLAQLLGLFAALAAALAAVGLYGVMSYSVNQRTREIGLRMALGAGPGGVLRMVMGEGFKLTAAGLALGLATAVALSRLMANRLFGQLFGVTATDPLTYAGVALLLAVVALLACWIPASRAARVDPMTALRLE